MQPDSLLWAAEGGSKSFKSGEGPRSTSQGIRTTQKRPGKDTSLFVTLYPCSNCQRFFCASSLKEHKDRCRQIKIKKETSMARSPLVDRWRDTSLEPFIDTLCYLPPPPRLYAYDWQAVRNQMYEDVGITDFEESWDEAVDASQVADDAEDPELNRKQTALSVDSE